ncbi:hypothetical protein Tco_1259184, partial [Tanacetum coccineum]
AHDPDYMSEPIYPEYIPLEDEDEFRAEEQPLPPVDSPTAESPGYVIEPAVPPSSTNISTVGARITVRLQTSISIPSEAEVERLLAMTTPSPSPPISLSPPFTGERLTRIASTQALIDAVTTALPSPPLPPLPPSLYIPPPVDCRDDILESEQLPRKRLYLSTLGFRYEGIRDVGYGIRDTWVDPAEAIPEIAPITVGEVNTRVTELAELHEHDTQDLYALLEDAQDRDSMDGGGGGLCFPRGLGSLDRIESGDSLGASDPS